MSEAEAKQSMETYFAALPRGAQPTSSAFFAAVDAMQREQNSLNPAGCVRAAAVPATMPPLAFCDVYDNVIALPAEGVVNLGRTGLLHPYVRAIQVSRTHATLVRDEVGLRIVAQGQGPVAVVPEQGTSTRLSMKGDTADVGIGDTIVLYPGAPSPHNEAFKLIEAPAPMEVEAPAAAPEISQPHAVVDQAQAAAFTSDAPMAAAPPRPAATGRDLLSDLNLASSAPAAPVDKRSGGATQRGAAHSEPPPSPLEVTSPMKTVGDELPHQSVKKGRAAKGAVETVTKEQTPADKRRAAKVRHEKVAAVLSLLVQYHATAPEASVETALDANDDSPTAAAMWLLDPNRTEKFSVRPVERA